MKCLIRTALACVLFSSFVPAAAASPAGSVFGIEDVLVGASPAPGSWISAEVLQGDPAYADRKIAGGEKFRVFSLDGLEGEGVATLPVPNPPDPPSVCVEDAGIRIGEASPWLNIRCGWDPLPRKAAALSTGDAVFKTAVQRFLAVKGETAAPHVTQVFKIDLEGDGTDEIIISAARFEHIFWDVEDLPYHSGMIFGPGAGDFSLVLLRKTEGNRVRDIPVAGYFAGKNEDDRPPVLYQVIGFADLDGDGTLEILTDASYFGGYRFGIHSVLGDRVREVLGCGSGPQPGSSK